MRKITLVLLCVISLVGCHKNKTTDINDDSIATKQSENEQIDAAFTVTPDVVDDGSLAENQNFYTEGDLFNLLDILNNTFNADGEYDSLSYDALTDMYTLSEDFASDGLGYYSVAEGAYNCLYVFADVTDVDVFHATSSEILGAIEATYQDQEFNIQQHDMFDEEGISYFVFGTENFVNQVDEIMQSYIGGVVNETN